MKTKSYRPLSRKNKIVVQELNDETLIYDLTADKAFCLNQTSAIVWQLCDGEKSFAEIADALSKDLKMLIGEDFVRLAISDLQKENLIENRTDQPMLEGKSRREIIRQIGLASMIALPVVSSLIAPNAVEAASACRTSGQSCTFNGWQQGNCCTSNLRCDNSPRVCRACIPNGGVYASGTVTTAAECEEACLTFYGGSSDAHNLCCSGVHSSNAYSFSGGTCSCRCG